MTDDERRALSERIDLARRIREDYASLAEVDEDTAKQVSRLAYRDAMDYANDVLRRYATERPPAP